MHCSATLNAEKILYIQVLLLRNHDLDNKLGPITWIWLSYMDLNVQVMAFIGTLEVSSLIFITYKWSL